MIHFRVGLRIGIFMQTVRLASYIDAAIKLFSRLDSLIQVNQTDTKEATLSDIHTCSWPSQEVDYARLYLKFNSSLADWFIKEQKYQQLAWIDFSMKFYNLDIGKP